MLIGYARGSTGEQDLDLQIDALQGAGCAKVFSDETSGVAAAPKGVPPGLHDALDSVREGDTLVVWRLDRLGRSLKDLVQKVEALKTRQAGLRSLDEGIDTTGAGGTGHSAVFAALAAFERDVARARAQGSPEAGRRSARARGRRGGRPKEMTAEKLELAVRLMKDPAVSIGEICRRLAVSKSTLYRYVGPDGSVRERAVQ